MSTLLWIEHDGTHFHPATLNAVTAAKSLGGICTAIVLGYQVSEIASSVALLEGVDRVLVSEAKYYFPFRAEPVAALLASIAPQFTHIVAASSTHSKNIFPRMAGLMDKPMLSDVLEVLTPKCFVRPIYAGNALAKETFDNDQVILTFRASRFEKATSKNQACPIESISPLADDARTKVLKEPYRHEEKPDLQSARIVVSGGRGFGSQENFQMVEQLADALGAAVGATRAAVDAGFISNDYQVGQTGKIVAPELYIAIGISGAIQHLAGMKDSKTIVAINRDADAPIFEIASYGLVGDLFSLVPEMIKELKMEK